MVDCPIEASIGLRNLGYSASCGTFGTPYKVPKTSGYVPVIGRANLPNCTEQEIVVVDLTPQSPSEEIPEGKHVPNEEPDIWSKCNKGFVNPRVRNASEHRRDFDRIFFGGGAFLVFASEKVNFELHLGMKSDRGLDIIEDFNGDCWSFNSELVDMHVEPDTGMEMRITNNHDSLTQLIKNHLKGATFTCRLSGGKRNENPWVPLVLNKYGDTVGLYRQTPEKGLIVVLPQIAEKAAFIQEFIGNVLPELSPHLFPDTGANWIQQSEYELPSINALLKEQEIIRQRAQQDIDLINLSVSKERDKDGWLHDLLTGTDSKLVQAVMKALHELGFSDVLDMDGVEDKANRSRREDLQIHGANPILVVDVKGLGGGITDNDALQADKHASLRLKENIGTSFRGLTIINHRRRIPPLDRESKPFREELIKIAIEQELGLLTSWDIFRALRNMRKLDWKPSDIKPLFYKHGLIEIVPSHYSFIGCVEKVWKQKGAFGILISSGELRKGDRIAIEFPIEFEESIVLSLLVNGVDKEDVKKNDEVGILWPDELPVLREGMRVFRVSP